MTEDTQTHSPWLQLCVSVVFNTRVSNEANGREYKYRTSHCGVGRLLLNIWQIWEIAAAAGSSGSNLRRPPLLPQKKHPGALFRGAKWLVLKAIKAKLGIDVCNISENKQSNKLGPLDHDPAEVTCAAC